MEKMSIAMLVALVQSYDQQQSQAAIKEIKRRGFDYHELLEELNR